MEKQLQEAKACIRKACRNHRCMMLASVAVLVTAAIVAIASCSPQKGDVGQHAVVQKPIDAKAPIVERKPGSETKHVEEAQAADVPVEKPSLVGMWRAEYVHKIISQDKPGSPTSAIETLEIREDGTFSRNRTMLGQEHPTSGKWRMKDGLLVLTLETPNGEAKSMTYRMVDFTQDSFELRFEDPSDFDRELISRGGAADSTYDDSGSLITKLVLNGKKPITICQTAKVFRRVKGKI